MEDIDDLMKSGNFFLLEIQNDRMKGIEDRVFEEVMIESFLEWKKDMYFRQVKQK